MVAVDMEKSTMGTSTKNKLPKPIIRPSNRQLFLSFSLGVTLFILLMIELLVDTTGPYLKYITRLRENTAMHDFLKSELVLAHCSVMLFNITNVEEFRTGKDKKLRVEEVGPFTYQEVRRNLDIQFDYEADLLRYTPNISLRFLPEESIASPEDVNITMPSIPMLGLTSNIRDGYGYILAKTFNVLAGGLDSKAIVSMDAAQYMWGYQEPIVAIAHTLIPGTIPFESMGIVDKLYEEQNYLEVSLKDDEKFMIKSRNGYKKLAMSDHGNPEECKMCSTFENTYEGMVYPSGITPDFPLRLFRNGLCKVLDMKFNGTKITDYGGEALVYHVDNKFYISEPNQTSSAIILLPDCYYGMPLALSNAHFLDADPKLYERIDGMHPDEKYRGRITIDPKVGIEIETVITLQMNLVLKDVSHNSEAAMFSNMIIPICYVTIRQPPLSDLNASSQIHLYQTWPKALLGIQIIVCLSTIASWIYFSILLYRLCAFTDESEDNNLSSPKAGGKC